MSDRPRYAIVNGVDAPAPDFVCQYVPGVGYCYLNRELAAHDGMDWDRATAMETFGFDWREDPDGTVTFIRTERPSTATYAGGEPRRWQHPADCFLHTQLLTGSKK